MKRTNANSSGAQIKTLLTTALALAALALVAAMI